MGQRLNIELMTKQNRPICNSYFHWSGFTDESIEMSIEVAKRFEELEKLEKDKHIFETIPETVLAIKSFEAIEAYLHLSELEAFKELCLINEVCYDVPVKVAVNRNNGLVNFTSQGMNENTSWEECNIKYNTYNKTFDISGAFESVTKEDIEEEYYKDYVDIQFEEGYFTNMTLEQLIDFKNSYDGYKFNFMLGNDGMVLQKIA